MKRIMKRKQYTLYLLGFLFFLALLFSKADNNNFSKKEGNPIYFGTIYETLTPLCFLPVTI